MRAGPRSRWTYLVSAMLFLAAASAAGSAAEEGSAPLKDTEVRPAAVNLPDVELLDQDGNRVRFRSDVVKDRLVVIDAIYTTCPLVCPILSATFSDLQELLGARLGEEVLLVSITVDPATDTPPRLKEYARRWDAKPGWVFLTGAKADVDRVLRGLGAYAPDFTEHPAAVLVGDAMGGEWARFFGFPTPRMLLERLDGLRGKRGGGPRAPRRLDEAAQREYFTDSPLLDQDGAPVRFYTDVLRGKIVLVSFFYTGCTDVCPVLMHTLRDVKDRIGERFGRDVFFVSISVDPENDTPEVLKEYAARYHQAGPGWTFLTGKRDDVDRVVGKLGQYTPGFEDHSTLFLIGDVKNARWRKVRGDLSPGEAASLLIDLLERR